MVLGEKIINKIFLIAACCLLFSCATPSEKFVTKAIEFEFNSAIVNSGHFQHRIFFNQLLTSPEKKIVHVYLDGDGTPWEKHRWVTDDPTARNPIILEMMVQDSSPAVLLGRPCYYGLGGGKPCRSKFWTSHRYSPEIVSSMVKALVFWLEKHDFNKIILIGYSGGGALAMLMAPKINQLETVVTIAANLDIDAWVQLHRYSPLSGSLNPAELTISDKIKLIHLIGGQDRVAPVSIIKKIAKNNNHSIFIEFPQFDHFCCWVKEWPHVLEIFNLDN